MKLSEALTDSQSCSESKFTYGTTRRMMEQNVRFPNLGGSLREEFPLLLTADSRKCSECIDRVGTSASLQVSLAFSAISGLSESGVLNPHSVAEEFEDKGLFALAASRDKAARPACAAFQPICSGSAILQ